MMARGRLSGKEKIGVRVGRIINKYKMAKHIHLDIEEDSFDYHVLEENVKAEAAMDGLYVIRTSLSEERLSMEDAVRRYKDLAQVERAFRSLKSIDLRVRPTCLCVSARRQVYHHLEKRVRSHIFLCMLAYYVQWHMKEVWRELLFNDEEQEQKKDRDPACLCVARRQVAPVQRSAKALKKVHSKRLEDDSKVHSFHTLLASLSTIIRNSCRRQGAGPQEASFTMMTRANPEQKRALALIDTITV